MAVRVSNNNLPDRAVGAAVQEAVLGAIGAPDGDWRVQIHENADSPSFLAGSIRDSAACAYCGVEISLDVDVRLRRSRSSAYKLARRAAAEHRWDDLGRRSMRHRPHSLMARVVLEAIAPERLPIAEDEMLDLIDCLWSDLRMLRRTQ
jgi:hypothetical protein